MTTGICANCLYPAPTFLVGRFCLFCALGMIDGELIQNPHRVAQTKGAQPEPAPPADVDDEASASMLEPHPYPGPEAPVK